MAIDTARPDKLAGRSWRIAGWGVAVLLLIIPFVAMQFTAEVNWTAGDFIFAGVMIGTVGLLFELAARKTGDRTYRGGVAAALGASFLTVWATGAVGMIGSEANPYNLLFAVPILVALGGSIIARFRAQGMARAMLAAGIVNAAIALGGVPIDARGAAFSLAFSAIWLAGAWLLGKAAAA